MLRRRLFAYTVMFAAGIAAGYLVFESQKYILSPLLMISLSIGIIRIKFNSENNFKERKKFFTFLILGFIIFTFKYIDFNSPIYSGDTKIDPLFQKKIEGRIINVIEEEDRLILVLKEKSIKGMGNIRVSFYGDLNFSNNISIERPIELLGAEVKCYGELREPTGADNPNCFNYRTYLRSKGIRYTFSAKYISVISTEAGVFWKYKRRIMQSREKFLDNFNEENEIRSFIKGVIFGDKTDIDEETLEEFSINSTGHILAVSGLHVGFLFALLNVITGKRRSMAITLIIFILLVAYGEMTLWSASTVRAVIMLTVGMFAMYVKRPFDLLSAVSFSAMVILIRNPYQLFVTGFQLSFLALLGISFLSKPVSYFVGDALAASLAVQISVAPLTAFTFNRLNPLSLFINIPVIFVSSIFVPISIIALALENFPGNTPGILIEITKGVSELLIEMNRRFAMDGIYALDTIGISPGLLITGYILIFIISSEWMRVMIMRDNKKEIFRGLSYLIVPVLALNIALFDVFFDDEIVFVSVGQGDCVHIKAGKNHAMIDGGGNRFYNVGKKILKPYLLKAGAGNLDIALITHPHTDHYLGIIELSEVYSIGKIIFPEVYKKACNSREDWFTEIDFINVKEKVVLSDNIEIQPIWPVSHKSADLSFNDPNENNMVYMIHYNDIKIMMTGDILESDELDMLEYYRGTEVLKCDVLKVAHHGSKTSTSDRFLDEVSPKIAVIQVGLNNIYGHPSPEILKKLQTRNIQVYRTDLNGAIGIDIRKNRILVDKMR